MKKLIGVVLIVILCSGCNAQRKKISRETNQLTTAYRIKMDKGQTTSDQDKAFIRAMNDVVVQLDCSIRSSEKANATKEQTEKALQNGYDPTTKVLLGNQ